MNAAVTAEIGPAECECLLVCEVCGVGGASSDDVRAASVLRGMSSDGGVCICLAQSVVGGVGGVWEGV